MFPHRKGNTNKMKITKLETRLKVNLSSQANYFWTQYLTGLVGTERLTHLRGWVVCTGAYYGNKIPTALIKLQTGECIGEYSEKIQFWGDII